MSLTIPKAGSILRHNVSWQEFEILAETASRAARLAYDRGTLEIMTPLPEHESYNRIIESFVTALAEELQFDIRKLGSTTWKREDLLRGVEPDSCYYIQNETRVRGKKQIDLRVDPPPDLVIEIDITSSSLSKRSIYAALGVPEIWRYDGQTLQVYRLQGEDYGKSDSLAFPQLAIKEVPQFIQQSEVVGETTALRSFRAWIRKHLEKLSSEI